MSEMACSKPIAKGLATIPEEMASNGINGVTHGINGTVPPNAAVLSSSEGPSISNGPTPPHPTRNSVAGDVQSVHETDLDAVANTLQPIEGELNEAAENAIFPSPPLNTPAYSPAPSVVARQFHRARGMSTIGDRLNQVALEDRHLNFTTPTETENNEDVDSTTGSIIIGLGSDRNYPLIEQYRAQSLATYQSNLQAMGSTETQGGHAGGVHEKSIWADEVMSDLEEAVKRLEQLAKDEAEANDGKPAPEYFLDRLQKVLSAPDREYPVASKLKEEDKEE